MNLLYCSSCIFLQVLLSQHGLALVMNTLNQEEEPVDGGEKISEKIVENMVKQVVTLNTDISLSDLSRIVEKQFEVIKYEQVATSKKIEEIFNKNINKYLKRVDHLEI